jgi:rare lipoprotein A
VTDPHHPRRRTLLWLAPLLPLALAGCATRPAPTPAPATPTSDGPDRPGAPPLDPLQVPDAVPVLEPIRSGGPNKPYQVLGELYKPLPPDAPLSERGLASWYGRKFHGRRTASGEIYNMHAMTAAHPTLPLPSFARVSNPANGRSVIVRVNDRGPFIKGRIIDLSYTAAQKLGLGGLGTVQVERITPEQIRNGAWQRGAPVIEGDEPPAAAGIEPATPPTAPGQARSARGFWIQLGAFRERAGAEQLQSQAGAALEGLAPLLTVFNEAALFRVQAGPFASREEAQRAAERVREAMLLVAVAVVVVVVERR